MGKYMGSTIDRIVEMTRTTAGVDLAAVVVVAAEVVVAADSIADVVDRYYTANRGIVVADR